MGVLICWIPYYLIPLPVPPRADGYEANAIASMSRAIATGTSIFQFPDPASGIFHRLLSSGS